MSLEEVRFMDEDFDDDYSTAYSSAASFTTCYVNSIGPPSFPGGQFDHRFMKMKCEACQFWNIYKIDKTMVLECGKCGSPLEPGG